jgi:hypothetical protein
MSIKRLSFRPQPLCETKINRRYPKVEPTKEKKIKRPPAVYGNVSWEETIKKYLNDGNEIPALPKVQKRKGVHEAE